ncbi:MAG: hypothetical protein Q7S16_05725 [bacterium]|nr:hypothetical protein [bacterium]
MSETIYEPLPGGCSWVTGGGTRTAVKLSRSWQRPLAECFKQSACPIETKPQEPIVLPDIPEEWLLLPNPMTPHRRHRLVVPARCWVAEDLQILGGEAAIVSALKIVRIATTNDDVEMAAFMHVGQLAGQNMWHPHWHLKEVRVREPLEVIGWQSSERFIVGTEEFAIYAEGIRAGQCLVVPKRRTVFTAPNIQKLAKLLSDFISRMNEKWKSTEGLPPEFSMVIRLAPDHTFRYASYYPILNHWGAPEYVMAPFEQGPFTLPWPHEVTAAYLRS